MACLSGEMLLPRLGSPLVQASTNRVDEMPVDQTPGGDFASLDGQKIKQVETVAPQLEQAPASTLTRPVSIMPQGC